jgi:hypothetical protein
MGLLTQDHVVPITKTYCCTQGWSAPRSSSSRRGNARRNCLNLKGVVAIKLVAAPRYQPRYVLSIPISSSDAPRGRRDAAKVHLIRTASVTDSHFARLYGVTAATIHDARVGDTWPAHPTPPDTAPRDQRARADGSSVER